MSGSNRTRKIPYRDLPLKAKKHIGKVFKSLKNLQATIKNSVEDKLVTQDQYLEISSLLTPKLAEPASNEGTIEKVIVKAEPAIQYFPSRYDRPEPILNTFELMKLPTELRLRIFYFLAPSTSTIDSLIGRREKSTSKTYQTKQTNLSFCREAILRTNRKIYGEIIELWYNSACYHVEVDWSLRFLGRQFQHPSELPYGFRFLAHLSLEFLLSGSDEIESMMIDEDKVKRMEETQGKGYMLRHIAELFGPSGPGKLQNLNICIRNRPHFFSPMGMYPSNRVPTSPERQRIVYAILHYNLCQLRDIRVSRSVSVVRAQKYCFGLLYCNSETVDDIIAVAEKYFRRLEREISGDFDKAEHTGELAKNDIIILMT